MNALPAGKGVAALWILQKRVYRDTQDSGETAQFNIRYKPFSGFNPLNGILIQINSGKLHPVSQRPL